MTREQVMSMSAQELAEATAVHVMGWKLVQHPSDGFDVWATNFNELGQIIEYREHHEWSPSEDISAAWEALEHLGKEVSVKRYEAMVGWRYWCRISDPNPTRYDECIAHGKTAPEAICKAALLAVIGI